MDGIDREIISLLHQDGRASMTDIAQHVGLSLSSCHRRFKELEKSGAIEGFTVNVNHNDLGYPFEAMVSVTMQAGSSTDIAAFEKAVADTPLITHAVRLFGQPDYQLTVVAKSAEHYQDIYDRELLELPGVQRLNSTLVMKNVVEKRLPL